MNQYLDLMFKCINYGLSKPNRTGVNHIGYQGDMCKYNLAEGFPVVTTKELNTKAVFAEMLGFLRGYDNAGDFRNLGCNVWNANANDNKQWLENENRKGVDDLGGIYGVQARKWGAKNGLKIDQLRKVINHLLLNIDDRREIVSHWNVGELNSMALPPCHLLYQFGIQGDKLNLTMYQRSCDVPLGVPFNIAGYSWLLSVIAHITGHKVGTFNHMMHDIHIYENQLDLCKQQLLRVPHKLPTLVINPDIKTLADLESWVTVDDFELKNYVHDARINYPFTV